MPVHVFFVLLPLFLENKEHATSKTALAGLPEGLQRRGIHQRSFSRPHRRHCRPAFGHRLRHRFRCDAGEGHHHSHCGRIHHLAARRHQGANRRPDRRLHRHHLRHRQQPRIRSSGPARGHHAGRTHPHRVGCVPTGRRHQVHSLPHCHRLHRRHRRHDLHHPDGRHHGPHAGSFGQRRQSHHRSPQDSGRFHRQMDMLH